MIHSLVRLVLPDLQDVLHDGTPADIGDALEPFHAADIASLVEGLPDDDALKLVLALEPNKLVETLGHLDTAQVARLVGLLGPEKAAPIAAKMASDDLADLVGALAPDLAQRLVQALPGEIRKDVQRLIKYPEGTAGALMTLDYVALRPDETVKDAIEHIRQVARKRETVYALYALGPGEVLTGAVTLETLILSPSDRTMADIMIPPISVRVDADQEAVVRTLQHYDFLALPIVDLDGRMLGIVTHDDILDVAVAEATEDAQRMGGVQPLRRGYFETPFLTLVRARAVWLSILFFTELIGGSVLREYEHTLSRSVALIFFLPLIIASGGNSGSQAASLIIRGIATNEVRTGDWRRILGRELASGATLGMLLGLYGLLVAIIWGVQHLAGVAIAVWLTLVAVVTLGSLLGSLMPLLMARVGVDPAITSSPLVTCLVDVLGIVTFVAVAGALLPGP